MYAGVDGGVGCPAAKSTLVDDGGAVTYCYTVTNTGNTHLDAIGLVDPIVTGTPTLLQAESQPLAPGASAHYYLDAVAPPAALVGFVTASVVTANPVDDTAADLVGLADVTSTDGARVDAVAAAAPEGPSPAAQAPAPAPAAPAVPQQPEPSPEGAPTASATAEAPTELAFTGWESWLIGAMGIGLIAGGWLLINREDQPLYATAGRTGRRSNPTATNPRSRSSRAD